MFEDSGNKLKTAASIVFLVSIVGVVILAITFGKDKWGDFSFLPFCAILLGGGISSYLSCLVLSAFGELVINSEKLISGFNVLNTRINKLIDDSLKNANQEGKEQAEKKPVELEKKPVEDDQKQEHIPDLCKETVLARISDLNDAAAMYAVVQELEAQSPGSFTPEVLKNLENAVTIGRIYGRNAGVESFINRLSEYLQNS